MEDLLGKCPMQMDGKDSVGGLKTIGLSVLIVNREKFIKNKKVGSTTYLFSLKLTNLTKPKLMKKNVLQMYAF